MLPMYLPRGLQKEKKLKQTKKNDDVPFFTMELPTEFIPSVNIVGKIVGKL
jgi:hypothetical protein